MFLSIFLQKGAAFPPWPGSYTIFGTWKVPYANLTNQIVISQEPSRQYINKLNGVNQIWQTTDEEKFYRKIVVADNQSICYDYNMSEGYQNEMVQFLPDPDGFYLKKGTYPYNGRQCDLWEKVIDGPKVSTYRVYIDRATGNPVGFVTKAISIFHSHYDIYVLDIERFERYPLPGAWNLPEICNNPVHYDPYPGAIQHGYGYKNSQSHSTNKQRYLHEKYGVSLGYRKSEGPVVDVCDTYYARGDINLSLYPEFSYRTNLDPNGDSPQNGKPRDQVSCGSCWAFSTAEVIESQFATKTGQFRQVSVNQIMDCTWDANNTGCQGGETAPALSSMIINQLDVASEEEYPYLGVSGICNRKPDHPMGRVTGCYHIDRTTQAVKEALIKFGPLSIAINVIEDMMLYTGGVIDNQECIGSADSLAHAVLLTGWRIIDGKEAWEVKNSWSTYWGYEGYLYIQSEHQEWNCGVTTEVVAAVVDLA